MTENDVISEKET